MTDELSTLDTMTERFGALGGDVSDAHPGQARATTGRGEWMVFDCHRCGEQIGVYEPLVVVTRAGARTTSRAAEPGLEASAGTYYHRDCHRAA
jgi:hypothetical protein